MNTNKDFGPIVRAWLNKERMPITELAKRVGYSKRGMYRILASPEIRLSQIRKFQAIMGDELILALHPSISNQISDRDQTIAFKDEEIKELQSKIDRLQLEVEIITRLIPRPQTP